MDSNGGVNDIKCSSSSSLASLSSTSVSGSSLISPMSLPSGSVDLYGRRRQMLRVQLLEREIALLQVCSTISPSIFSIHYPVIAMNNTIRSFACSMRVTHLYFHGRLLTPGYIFFSGKIINGKRFVRCTSSKKEFQPHESLHFSDRTS